MTFDGVRFTNLSENQLTTVCQEYAKFFFFGGGSDDLEGLVPPTPAWNRQWSAHGYYEKTRADMLVWSS